MTDATYRTKGGEVLDAICHRHYGRIEGNIEQVLETNPGLAGRGAILPRGIRITLPAVPGRDSTPAILPTIRLWD